MPRPIRIEFPGANYHVTSRGDRREPIFVDDTDRTVLLAVLAQDARGPRNAAVMMECPETARPRPASWPIDEQRRDDRCRTLTQPARSLRWRT